VAADDYYSTSMYVLGPPGFGSLDFGPYRQSLRQEPFSRSEDDDEEITVTNPT
jgi:hypothetical protein